MSPWTLKALASFPPFVSRDTLRLTGTETELLPALDRGVALWKVGRRSFIVRHRRSRAEEALSNTDARMAASGAP